jgi:phospholipid transport system transporter-binding protein
MLNLPAQLTLQTAQAVLDGLLPAIASSSEDTITVDAQALTQIDTSTLAVLLECRRRAVAAKRQFAVHQPPARLLELARLYGVQDLLALQA